MGLAQVSKKPVLFFALSKFESINNTLQHCTTLWRTCFATIVQFEELSSHISSLSRSSKHIVSIECIIILSSWCDVTVREGGGN